MAIKIGDTQITFNKLFIGSSAVQKVYIGNILIFPYSVSDEFIVGSYLPAYGLNISALGL
jgi:hypothetical protein